MNEALGFVDIGKKLAIGTAQFGMDYGLANIRGKTSPAEVRRILNLARDAGISILDTAYLYGVSEEVLGSIPRSQYFRIVTKTPHFDEEEISDESVRLLDAAFRQSQNRLGRNPYALLVHRGVDLLKGGADRLYKALAEVRESGDVEKIGVSVYDPEECRAVFDRYDLDIVQLPLNVFDQAFLSANTLRDLKEDGVEVHVRSVFLQGAILMENLPEKLGRLAPAHRKFRQFCGKCRMSLVEGALSFPFGLHEVDRIVVGINDSFQLNQILNSRIPELKSECFSNFRLDGEAITKPQNWDFHC